MHFYAKKQFVPFTPAACMHFLRADWHPEYRIVTFPMVKVHPAYRIVTFPMVKVHPPYRIAGFVRAFPFKVHLSANNWGIQAASPPSQAASQPTTADNILAGE